MQRSIRTGLALRDAVAWHDFRQIVQTAEDTGYETVFLPEIAGREAFSTLAALAGETSRLRLGTGVVTMASRSAMVTAMAVATVDERSDGRIVLGLGAGPVGPGALERLRAYVLAVRGLLAGDEVEVERGEHVRLSTPPRSVPIWLAALGPKAMRLAGEVADGVVLNWCPPERVAFARERIREGAEATGRDAASITVAVYVRACVGEDDQEAALAALRAAAARYASYPAYRRQFEAVGLGAQSAAAALARRDANPSAVPEAFVRALCLEGTAAEAQKGLEAYRDAGADLPVVYPVPCREPVSSVMGTMFALAPHPALES